MEIVQSARPRLLLYNILNSSTSPLDSAVYCTLYVTFRSLTGLQALRRSHFTEMTVGLEKLERTLTGRSETP